MFRNIIISFTFLIAISLFQLIATGIAEAQSNTETRSESSPVDTGNSATRRTMERTAALPATPPLMRKLQEIDELAQTDPNSAIPLYKELIEEADKSDIAMNRDFAEAANNLGVLYLDLGRYQEAATVLEDAYTKATNRDGSPTPLIKVNYALSLYVKAQAESDASTAKSLRDEALSLATSVIGNTHNSIDVNSANPSYAPEQQNLTAIFLVGKTLYEKGVEQLVKNTGGRCDQILLDIPDDNTPAINVDPRGRANYFTRKRRALAPDLVRSEAIFAYTIESGSVEGGSSASELLRATTQLASVQIMLGKYYDAWDTSTEAVKIAQQMKSANEDKSAIAKYLIAHAYAVRGFIRHHDTIADCIEINKPDSCHSRALELYLEDSELDDYLNNNSKKYISRYLDTSMLAPAQRDLFTLFDSVGAYSKALDELGLPYDLTESGFASKIENKINDSTFTIDHRELGAMLYYNLACVLTLQGEDINDIIKYLAATGLLVPNDEKAKQYGVLINTELVKEGNKYVYKYDPDFDALSFNYDDAKRMKELSSKFNQSQASRRNALLPMLR